MANTRPYTTQRRAVRTLEPRLHEPLAPPDGAVPRGRGQGLVGMPCASATTPLPKGIADLPRPNCVPRVYTYLI